MKIQFWIPNFDEFHAFKIVLISVLSNFKERKLEYITVYPRTVHPETVYPQNIYPQDSLSPKQFIPGTVYP